MNGDFEHQVTGNGHFAATEVKLQEQKATLKYNMFKGLKMEIKSCRLLIKKLFDTLFTPPGAVSQLVQWFILDLRPS
uniref:Ovule protein n=1 Tax=Echinococcus granulosus TaxID=6210 RepID=A0A068W754_ECHGR|nr:hypothetical protein EgrG_002011600 [Echinococcus granulosus]